MKIEKNKNNNVMTLSISGRLDTLTAPDLEKEIEELSSTDVTELVIDMKELEYTSSAGLRALLKAQKLMNEKGKMEIINVNETIMEVFEITGFSDILSIK